MLTLSITGKELFIQETLEFIDVPSTTVSLEHSLLSISKWETIWNKPFLTKQNRTRNEMISYVECMCVDENIDPHIFLCLSGSDIEQITKYIERKKTATVVRNDKSSTSREIITSEVIYYWMIQCGIPFECEKWPLDRLLTLINVCNAKSQKPSKMKQREIMNNNKSLNAARRKALHSKG